MTSAGWKARRTSLTLAEHSGFVKSAMCRQISRVFRTPTLTPSQTLKSKTKEERMTCDECGRECAEKFKYLCLSGKIIDLCASCWTELVKHSGGMISAIHEHACPDKGGENGKAL